MSARRETRLDWGGFAGGKVDRLHSKRLGRILRGAFSKLEAGDHRRPYTLEACSFEQIEHLSFQESTSDSTGPEFWVVDDRLRKLFRTHNIGDRETSSGLERPEHLLDYATLPKR